MGWCQGKALDIEIHAKEILQLREVLNQILAKHTKQPIDKISKDTERDFYMSAAEAKDYGLVDEVIEQNK